MPCLSSRCVKLWLALLLIAGCAAGGTGAPRERLTIKIQNANWWATTVYVVCHSGRRIVIRGLIYGESRRERRTVRDCRSVDVYVLGLGNRSFRSRQPVLVSNGDTICLEIQPSPYLTTFAFNCTIRTE